MSDLAVVETEALDRLREWGGEALVVKMLKLFLEHAPERVREIRTGIESGALEVTQRAAHSLKSSAGNLGARRLQAGAETMEGLAENGERKAVEDLLPSLDSIFRETRASLEEVVRSLPTEGEGS